MMKELNYKVKISVQSHRAKAVETDINLGNLDS